MNTVSSFHAFYRDTRDDTGKHVNWCRPAQHVPVAPEVRDRILPLIEDYHNVWDHWAKDPTYEPPLLRLIKDCDPDLVLVVDSVTLCAHPSNIPMFGTYADLCFRLRRVEQLKAWARLMLHPDWFNLEDQARFDIHSVLVDAGWLWATAGDAARFWQTACLFGLLRVKPIVVAAVKPDVQSDPKWIALADTMSKIPSLDPSRFEYTPMCTFGGVVTRHDWTRTLVKVKP
jgi:hypothetical protein